MAETVNQTVEKRGTRKERVGDVISNKMAKTIVVRVERRFPHPQFKKVVTAFTKFTRTTRRLRPRLATRCASRKPARCPSSSAGGWWQWWKEQRGVDRVAA